MLFCYDMLRYVTLVAEPQKFFILQYEMKLKLMLLFYVMVCYVTLRYVSGWIAENFHSTI